MGYKFWLVQGACVVAVTLLLGGPDKYILTFGFCLIGTGLGLVLVFLIDNRTRSRQ